jgi:malonate-semialdehyde dehydrogenase (acetylating) / methylmalonate-semialdehyde dehydrogenase
MAISVAVPVGEKTGDRLIEALAPKIRMMKVGHATDPESEMGSVITAEAKQRITHLIGEGVKEGQKLVVDGRGLELQGYKRRFFLGAFLFDRVTKDMTIYKTEIFGPVLCVAAREPAMWMLPISSTATNTATAPPSLPATEIRLAPSPLRSKSAWSASMYRSRFRLPIIPSEGGNGRFSRHFIYGPEGERFYTRLKTMSARWPTGIRAGAEFNFPSLK